MIEKLLESFAPPSLVSLINDASFWVNVSLYGLLTLACAFVIVASLRPENRKWWLQAAAAAAFCGFISDEFVYRYYKGETQVPDIQRLPSSYLSAPVINAWSWKTLLEVRRFSVKSTPYSELELVYFGGRWAQYLLHKPFSFLGGKSALLICPSRRF